MWFISKLLKGDLSLRSNFSKLIYESIEKFPAIETRIEGIA